MTKIKNKFLNIQANNFRKKYSTNLNQTNIKYHIFTLSIPIKNPRNTNFWSSIYSTIYIENYSLEKKWFSK